MNRALVFLDPRIRLLSALIFITIIIVTYFPAVFWKAAAYLMLMILVFWLISPAKVRRLKNIIKLSWFLISLFAFLALTIYLFSSEKIESRQKAFLDLAIKTFLIWIALSIFIIDDDFDNLIKGLYVARFPSGLVAMMTFAYRYFILLKEELLSIFRARSSRTLTKRSPWEELKITAVILEQYLSRLVGRSERIYAALLSRGFQGKVHFLIDFRLRAKDYLFLLGFGGLVILIKII